MSINVQVMECAPRGELGQNEAWELVFGMVGAVALRTTVIVDGKRDDLAASITAGAQFAKRRFETMLKFNERKENND